MRSGTIRRASVWLALALLVSACGARLTDDQRAAGIGGFGAGGAGGGSTVGGTNGGGTGGTGGTGPGAVGGGGGLPGTGGSVTPTQPPGGNGGATDVGVTGTELTIATVSDISGLQPGLFKSTHQAIQAFSAMINSEGGLDGRLLKPVLIDSKTNSDGNLAGVVQGCQKAFALVGSMSAFDDGGAKEIDSCGIPDVSAITVNPSRTFAENSFPAYPVRPDYMLVAPGRYLKKKYPGAEKNAAYLYLNAAVTKITAEQRMKGYRKIGYDFIYTAAVQLAETNYNSYVQAMKNHNPPIKYVSMSADFQSINRLLRAMVQQKWKPQVLDFDSVLYDPDYHGDAQGAGEGIHVYLNTALLEEGSGNPEIQLYQRWLGQVAPGAKPDYFGLYAWSAGRLFVEMAKKAGPKLKREALLSELKKLHAWTGNGLHSSHDIGNNLAAGCFTYVTVKGQSFVREAPASGQTCEKDGNVQVPL